MIQYTIADKRRVRLDEMIAQRREKLNNQRTRRWSAATRKQEMAFFNTVRPEIILYYDKIPTGPADAVQAALQEKICNLQL